MDAETSQELYRVGNDYPQRYCHSQNGLLVGKVLEKSDARSFILFTHAGVINLVTQKRNYVYDVCVLSQTHVLLTVATGERTDGE